MANRRGMKKILEFLIRDLFSSIGEILTLGTSNESLNKKFIKSRFNKG